MLQPDEEQTLPPVETQGENPSLQFELVQEQDGDVAEESVANVSQVTAEDSIEDLENFAVDDEEAPQNLPAESEELTPEQASIAAQMTAAMVTGTVATGIEFFVKPAKVSDDQRNEFKDALAAVLAKSGGVMPEWLARLLDEWKEELVLARKTVAIGWAIKDQVKEERAKQIDMPVNVPGRGDKPRYRVPREESSGVA